MKDEKFNCTTPPCKEFIVVGCPVQMVDLALSID